MFIASWFSCVATNGENVGIYTAQNAGAKVFFSMGDNPYMQQTSTSYGVSRSPLDKDSTVADFTNAYAQMHNAPAIQSCQASQYDYYMIPDDHEWGGDNWDHTGTQANAQTGIGAVSQADVDLHWYRGIQAFQLAAATYSANPENTDTEAVAEKPSDHERSSLADFGVITAAANQYPVIYFRQGYDIDGNKVSTNPHVEFFAIDCMSYKSPLASTDNSSKTCIGANQKAWLKAKLLASTATFKIIVSGKKTYNAASDNGDTWSQYTTERDEILTYIASNSITGVLWLAGDKHHPHVISTSIAGGDTYDHACIVACPVGVETNALDITTATELIWSYDAKVVGLLYIYKTYIEAKLVNNASGKVYSTWKLLAGENKLDFSTQSVSI